MRGGSHLASDAHGERSRQRGAGFLAKRAIDALAAGLGLLLASPLMAAVALAIRIRLGAPVLFRQVRPGLGGRPFELLKFRTMREALGQDGQQLPDAQRLDGFGRWLRSTSLDELPQLLNVLRGDLSLVGPRPLLVRYLDRYTPEQRRRHDVLPGLTGWAQVNGRNALSWDQKFALDVWYVDHWDFWLDLRILLLTVSRVLRRSGISREGSATMPEFMGSTESSEREQSR